MKVVDNFNTSKMDCNAFFCLLEKLVVGSGVLLIIGISAFMILFIGMYLL